MERLPTLRWLTRSAEDIAVSAEPVATALRGVLGDSANVEIIACESQIGSGALPTRTVASTGIAIAPTSNTTTSSGVWLDTLAENFRRLLKPVIGRIHNDRFILDLRCLDNADDFIASLATLEPPQ